MQLKKSTCGWTGMFSPKTGSLLVYFRTCGLLITTLRNITITIYMNHGLVWYQHDYYFFMTQPNNPSPHSGIWLGSVQVLYKHIRGGGGLKDMLILLMWLEAKWLYCLCKGSKLLFTWKWLLSLWNITSLFGQRPYMTKSVIYILNNFYTQNFMPWSNILSNSRMYMYFLIYGLWPKI